MFGGRDRFGAQGRKSLAFRQLRYSVPDGTHRRNKDRIGQLQQAASELPSTVTRPISGDGSASGTHNALAETHVVEICGGQFARRGKSHKFASLLTGEDIP